MDIPRMSATMKKSIRAASADLVLRDYKLNAGEILTLENQDIARARRDGTIKPFDGTLKSLVAA